MFTGRDNVYKDPKGRSGNKDLCLLWQNNKNESHRQTLIIIMCQQRIPKSFSRNDNHIAQGRQWLHLWNALCHFCAFAFHQRNTAWNSGWYWYKPEEHVCLWSQKRTVRNIQDWMPSERVQYCSLLREADQVWRGRCWKNCVLCKWFHSVLQGFALWTLGLGVAMWKLVGPVRGLTKEDTVPTSFHAQAWASVSCICTSSIPNDPAHAHRDIPTDAIKEKTETHPGSWSKHGTEQ